MEASIPHPERVDDERALSAPEVQGLRTLLAKEAICSLLSRYFDRLDANRIDEIEPLLAEDVAAELMTGKRYEGKQAVLRALKRMMAQYAATTHHVSNLQVELDGNQATSVSYLYAFHRLLETGTPWELWAQLHDRFVLVESGWQIQERLLVPIDAHPNWEKIRDEWITGHPRRIATTDD